MYENSEQASMNTSFKLTIGQHGGSPIKHKFDDSNSLSALDQAQYIGGWSEDGTAREGFGIQNWANGD